MYKKTAWNSNTQIGKNNEIFYQKSAIKIIKMKTTQSKQTNNNQNLQKHISYLQSK
ncbi:hypothetical protein AM305_07934 [Actinobacillus minor NM305]|uniref:Uncharacterized protein n=1 Tax=Actinobacillus minor NM305 TaxID=637911 RepID=C5S108_9PAST|nr:hypothetical protein AM305_07934 [Actinobacillus minor NM305]